MNECPGWNEPDVNPFEKKAKDAMKAQIDASVLKRQMKISYGP